MKHFMARIVVFARFSARRRTPATAQDLVPQLNCVI